MRYLLTPGKRSVPDPEKGPDAQKDEAILTADLWPGPWTLEFTDPALRRRAVFPLTDEGRAAAAQWLADAYAAEPETWKKKASLLDSDPWQPPAEEPGQPG